MATIRDIAKQTGYSIGTISRVLNKDSDFVVSDTTREIILTCANEMNYVSKNKTSKSNASEKTMWTEKDLKDYKVGIIPIGLDNLERGELHDPYYLYIRQGIERRLSKLGMQNASIVHLSDESDFEKLKDIDCVFFIGNKKFNKKNPYFEKIEHTVFVDCEVGNFDSVMSDFHHAVSMAVEYMLERDCRTIGYIGSWDYLYDLTNGTMLQREDKRLQAFRACIKDQKIEDMNHIYLVDEFTQEYGYLLACQAIRSGNLPDGFLVASDPMSMGVYRAFSESGLRIGKDVKIVSFNDTNNAAFMTPSLTSIHIHTLEMGELAVECMKGQIEGRKVPIKVALPTYITQRESC